MHEFQRLHWSTLPIRLALERKSRQHLQLQYASVRRHLVQPWSEPNVWNQFVPARHGAYRHMLVCHDLQFSKYGWIHLSAPHLDRGQIHIQGLHPFGLIQIFRLYVLGRESCSTWFQFR